VPDYRAALTDELRGVRIGVVRHFWEEELRIDDELRTATEGALATLERLGARLEDVRMRSLQAYHDVKTIISMCELFSINHHDLIERPGDFGADYLGRGGLAGCLFIGADYMHAQRERRSMLEEMKPLYEKYDVLVTAGAGPAPRLDSHRTLSFWEKLNTFSPFSVTSGPTLIVCCGFSSGGLPLGLQIAGRPFDEQGVLRIGHAYERAMQCRSRRPELVAGRARPPVKAAEIPPIPGDVSDTVLQWARTAAAHAGLKLTETQFAQLASAAPHALAMSQRIRRKRDRADEPASTFHLD
jgi:aspartyl-tRNA(Asn)/glutamyl-tRNA(Gln) amidotransferase subunit A